MTTSFYPRFLAFIALILFVGNSFAQPSTVKNLQPTLSATPDIKIYKNVIEEFEKKFTGAEDVRWEKTQKHFLAKFSIGDVSKRVLLNARGNIIYEITYGTEKHLPAKTRKDLKRNYVEFKITSATLVKEANRNIWVVNLEDDVHFVMARVEHDEIEEVKRYQKSKL